MVANTFNVDPLLQDDVQSFWTFEQSQTDQGGGPILPDAHAELIFNFSASHILDLASGQQFEMPSVSLNGLQDRPLHFRIKGPCQFIAVRLNAWAMRRFIDLPDSFCTLPAIPLGGIWKDFARTLEATFRRSGYLEAIACLQQFILDMRRPESNLASIRAAGERLDVSLGNVSLDDLALRSNLSPRQFERQFKHWTGVSPKTYARLIRHETARRLLTSDPNHSVVALAQDFGYTDQAHFIHDFKAFTSVTPGQYVARIRASQQQ